MDAHILITGGAGFIGSNTARFLVMQGHEIKIIDNFSTGSKENVADIRKHVDVLEIDVRDLDALQSAFRGVTHVLHLAAVPSVPRSLRDPATSHAVNVDGTFNVLLAARDAGVRKVVYAGSSSAYGNQPGDTGIAPKIETMTPAPLSPYAVTKLLGEYYCQVFSKNFGLPTATVRYFNVFGPFQDPRSEYAAVIPLFVTRMLARQQPRIQGDGKQSRDFTYIENVVSANILALESEKAVNGEVINIACGESHSLLDLVNTINTSLGTSVEPEFTDPRPGDVRMSLADITRAKEFLGYSPSVTFHEGIKKTIAWYKNRLDVQDKKA